MDCVTIALILFGIFILYTLINKNKDKFTVISDIAAKSNYDSYTVDNKQANSNIIIKGGDKDNYPLGTNDLNITEPVPPIIIPKQDEAFKDNQFIRDEGLTKAINNKIQQNDEDYKNVAQVYNNYRIPVDSLDLLTSKQISDFSKEELDNSTLHDIFNGMTAKVNNNISSDEINRITGKPIEYEGVKNLYKPVYSSIENDEMILFNDNLHKSLFTGYSSLPFGSNL
jgi:hypothetical protein